MMIEQLKQWVRSRPSTSIMIDGDDYMDRYHLLKTKWLRIRLHKINLPDPGRDVHDHPFNFVSIVLKGGYTEARLVNLRRTWNSRWFGNTVVSRRPRYSVAFRGARTFHRITSVAPNTWTLVFTGRLCRQWGFLHNGKWMHHAFYDDLGELQKAP